MCTTYYNTNGCSCGGSRSSNGAFWFSVGGDCGGTCAQADTSCGCSAFWGGSYQRMCRGNDGTIYVRSGCQNNGGCGNRCRCSSAVCVASSSLSTLSGEAYYERLYGTGRSGCGCYSAT